MQNFFWITGGLFIAGFGLLFFVLAVIFIRCAIEARRESRKQKAVDAAKAVLARNLSSLRNWFTEFPEIEGLIDLMAYRLQYYGGIAGGEIRRDWIAKMEKLQDERRKKQSAEWENVLRRTTKIVVPAEAPKRDPIINAFCASVGSQCARRYPGLTQPFVMNGKLIATNRTELVAINSTAPDTEDGEARPNKASLRAILAYVDLVESWHPWKDVDSLKSYTTTVNVEDRIEHGQVIEIGQGTYRKSGIELLQSMKPTTWGELPGNCIVAKFDGGFAVCMQTTGRVNPTPAEAATDEPSPPPLAGERL